MPALEVMHACAVSGLSLQRCGLRYGHHWNDVAAFLEFLRFVALDCLICNPFVL
jgi:hypothetical protein